MRKHIEGSKQKVLSCYRQWQIYSSGSSWFLNYRVWPAVAV